MTALKVGKVLVNVALPSCDNTQVEISTINDKLDNFIPEHVRSLQLCSRFRCNQVWSTNILVLYSLIILHQNVLNKTLYLIHFYPLDNVIRVGHTPQHHVFIISWQTTELGVSVLEWSEQRGVDNDMIEHDFRQSAGDLYTSRYSCLTPPAVDQLITKINTVSQQSLKQPPRDGCGVWSGCSGFSLSIGLFSSITSGVTS